MNTIHVDPKEMSSELETIFKKAFPSYNGKMFKIRTVEGRGPINCTSHWSGGSRDYYALVSLTGAVMHLPQSGTPFDKVDASSVMIPEGCGIVEHSIFQGKDFGLTLIIPQENVAGLLPAPTEEITEDQKKVLAATAGLIASYRREALVRAGISAARYEELCGELIETGHLRKNKSITPKGRNAVGNYRLRGY